MFAEVARDGSFRSRHRAGLWETSRVSLRAQLTKSYESTRFLDDAEKDWVEVGSAREKLIPSKFASLPQDWVALASDGADSSRGFKNPLLETSLLALHPSFLRVSSDFADAYTVNRMLLRLRDSGFTLREVRMCPSPWQQSEDDARGLGDWLLLSLTAENAVASLSLLRPKLLQSAGLSDALESSRSDSHEDAASRWSSVTGQMSFSAMQGRVRGSAPAASVSLSSASGAKARDSPFLWCPRRVSEALALLQACF